ncbi:MAG TPA: heavy-metal-associated domain-containing protein [Ignavibacteria bacterium]|nr:heavy-metal-associated domain-containing protein [Ignavibacteria bacterium]HQY52727.1 heavy-metal-associated domain-containing protein [Ignavibacteria bacterium]HRB01027.1 heavy-metal-associated domain-containing protein [Ignavibacteria bacterium]
MKSAISKNLKVIFAIFFMVTLIPMLSKADNKGNEKTVEITLPSIQCGMCVKTVEKALGNLDGVIDSKADLDNKSVTVIYDDSKVSVENLEAVITASGYDANKMPANEDAYNELNACCKKPK